MPVIGGIGDGQPFSNTLPKWFGPPGECGACGCWYCVDPRALMVGEDSYGYGYTPDSGCCHGLDGTFMLGSSNYSVSNTWTFYTGSLSGSQGCKLSPFAGDAGSCMISYRVPQLRRWDVLTTVGFPNICTLIDVDFEVPGKPFNMIKMCATYNDVANGVLYGLVLRDMFLYARVGNFGTGATLTGGGYRFGKPSLNAYIEMQYTQVQLFYPTSSSPCTSTSLYGPGAGGLIIVRYEYAHEDLDCATVDEDAVYSCTNIRVAATGTETLPDLGAMKIKWGDYFNSPRTYQLFDICPAPDLHLVF